MSNEISIKFGSLALDDNSNISVSEIGKKENKAVQATPIPVTDGSIAETARRASLTISVSGDIIGTNYDNLRSNIDALRAALQNGLQKFTTDDDRYIMAQLKDFDFAYKTLRVRGTWHATFIAHYPFWLAETATVDNRTPTSGSGYTITNNGNAPARVKIEITPTGSMADACKIENQTNGQSCQYRGTVAANNSLEIDNRYDTDDFQVLNNGADDVANFEGDFITLNPGANTIVFTGTTSTGVKLTFKDCYY